MSELPLAGVAGRVDVPYVCTSVIDAFLLDQESQDEFAQLMAQPDRYESPFGPPSVFGDS